MAELDYSEYTPDEYELYRARHENNEYIDYSLFQNKAFFRTDINSFQIVVDDFYKYENIENAVENSNEKRLNNNETLVDDTIDEEEKAYNIRIKETAKEKYAVGFSDNDGEKPLINIYSGASVKLNYGEGLLDFIYADFETPIRETYKSERLFEMFFEGVHSESGGIKEESLSEKIYNRKQLILHDFEQYEIAFNLIRDIAYASLYSSICPPIFKTEKEFSKVIKIYAEYILSLQKEYRNLIEFCYDENLFPDTLSYITPAEKYSIYKAMINFPTSIRRCEVFGTGLAVSAGKEAPLYPVNDTDNVRYRLQNPVSDESVKELADKYNIDPHKLALYLTLPRGVSVYYEFGSLREILELEFTKMLERNIRFRKCKRCDRYFIMKGNYDTNYCDRIEEGTNRTCKDLAAQENYKKKTEGNEAIALYHKYYKRYAARVKVRQIKEPEFKKWKYEALVKRDECSDGKITPAEYTEWLEGCFPNRKKNN